MPVTPRSKAPEPPSSAKGEDDIPSVGSVLDFGEAGAYTLEAHLGQGGMGEVYRARQVGAKGFSQQVAIKRLRADSRPSAAGAFVYEARVLSRLHHENIARAYGFHELNGRLYLIMEYIEGQSLRALLKLAQRKGYRFPEPVACELMAQVADALSCAHHATDEAGKPLQIIHRDVSPSNIIITESGRAVLLDFGVARHNMEGRAVTRSGFIKGKTPYLSPEQVKELPLDARSDLFPVGTILVELLIGQAPFGSTYDWVPLVRIGAVTPEYVAALLPDVSRPLRAICQKLLASHPEQRFADGAEVRRALRRHARLHDAPQVVQETVAKLRALPDVQPPPTPPQLPPLRLPEKRSRYPVALVGALAFACVVGAGYLVRRYIPVSGSPPPLQEPAPPVVSSPAPPVPPPSGPLVGRLNTKGGAKVAAGSAQRNNVVVPPPPDPAPGKPPALPGRLERRGDGAVSLSDDSDKSMGPLRDELVTAQSPSEAVAAQHALAELFATGNARLARFRQASRDQITVNGVTVDTALWMNDASGTVAIVVDLPNPNNAPPWEPIEGRIISHVRSSSGSPVALRAMPRVIPPGQRGRVALVFNRSAIQDNAMVEILRDSRPDFAIKVSSQELEPRNSLWRHYGLSESGDAVAHVLSARLPSSRQRRHA